ncbi:MAG: GIY-YIG nuclease family protein [Candidatus Aminicenantes bacterium]|nr:GIY-YIG nuclease family protein [Candidatus Aminicenantes bacterium]
MMDRRKELIRQYKDNPPPAGVFQIRNRVSGKIYVSSAPSVDGKLNSQRFMLQAGGHVNKDLQRDFAAQQPEDFAFEVLEYLKPQDPAASLVVVRGALAEMEKCWLEKLRPYGDKGYNKPPA